MCCVIVITSDGVALYTKMSGELLCLCLIACAKSYVSALASFFASPCPLGQDMRGDLLGEVIGALSDKLYGMMLLSRKDHSFGEVIEASSDKLCDMVLSSRKDHLHPLQLCSYVPFKRRDDLFPLQLCGSVLLNCKLYSVDLQLCASVPLNCKVHFIFLLLYDSGPTNSNDSLSCLQLCAFMQSTGLRDFITFFCSNMIRGL